MKFLLISPKNRTVWNFRGDLIKAIQNKGYEVIVTGPDDTDLDLINALGVRFVEIPMNKTGTSVFADMKYCRALYRLMRIEKPDVTLGYTIKPVVYGAIAAQYAGIKNINGLITGGGYTFVSKSLKARVLGVVVRALYRIGLSKCTHVIFQNHDDLNEFAERGLVEKNKCSVVNGSGVNMEKFHPAAMRDESRPLTFLMISRLLKSKGVMEYLEAAKVVKAEHPEVQFKLVGKYEYDMQDAIPEAVVKEYENAGIIKRFEETNDIVHYYQECDVYVLPSYREGTPRTVLEAMACSKPIITTDTNGCRETVVDGKNGFLIPVKDSTAVEEKMKIFIADIDLAEKMSEESLDYCREKFEVNIINKKMIDAMNL